MTFDEYQKGVLRTATGVCTVTKDDMLLNGIMEDIDKCLHDGEDSICRR